MAIAAPRDAYITNDATNAPALSKNSCAVFPNLVELTQECLVILNMSQLTVSLLIFF
jgi:hypothetical protein